MPSIKEMSVTLRVDHILLQEYATRTMEDGSVECHVASEANKMFKIVMINSSITMSFACHILTDGLEADSLICGPSSSITCNGMATNRNGFHPFLFTRLQVTDDERIASLDSRNWASIGTIEVRMYRCAVVAINRETPNQWRPLPFTDAPIHERSKKAGIHRVSFGQEVTHSPLDVVGTHYLDPIHMPYATVRFRYRPMAILMAQGIVPLPDRSRNSHRRGRAGDVRSPAGYDCRNQRPRLSLRAQTQERENRMIAADVADLEEQVRRLQEKIALKKGSRVVKREASPVRVPSTSSTSRIVIDLTDDL